MINVPLEATVECRDGFAGQSVCVIINRKEGRITHFVVREKLAPICSGRFLFKELWIPAAIPFA